MAIDKLSVSFDADLAGVVREAAADEGTSVSAWLSGAAEDRIRNRLLRIALEEVARETGPMRAEQVARLVAEARRAAIVTRPNAGHGT